MHAVTGGGAFDEAHETFRDELASVHRDGRRRWIYARQPSGPRYRARTLVAWTLLAALVAGPLVTVGGQPLVLFNVIERRFVFLGLVFWPQDFGLVVLIALTALVTLALTTTAVGRVWCGWLCPQTVFMEMVFRKLEYLIDGSAEQQVRRANGQWDAARVTRWAAKQTLFFALSFAIANLFLAYVIGAKALGSMVTDPPSRHLAGLVAITIFSLLFYGVFARFREQACTLACPYGRLMSALMDRETLTVTYDRRRGEPRTRLRATDAGGRGGDCIDCGQCVTVCPTGIDIRNGSQLECVSCTACVDACNGVMRRVARPSGLIRVTSIAAIESGTSRWLTGRVKAYTAIWVALVIAVVTLVARRPAIDALILRRPGTLYTRVSADTVANFYTVQVMSRTAARAPLEFVAIEPAGATITPLGLAETTPFGLVEGRLVVQVPTRELTAPSVPVTFEVRAGGRAIDRVTSSFVGPAPGRQE